MTGGATKQKRILWRESATSAGFLQPRGHGVAPPPNAQTVLARFLGIAPTPSKRTSRREVHGLERMDGARKDFKPVSQRVAAMVMGSHD